MKWFVAVVGINQEFLAQRELKKKRCEVYCPVGRKTIRHARRQETRIFPVFSRYLFVNIVPDAESLAMVRATDGILDFITNNWQPVAVDDDKIEEIKQSELAGEFDHKAPKRAEKQKWSRSFEILKRLLDPAQPVRV
jgi:transcription antitermination factor NusG